MQEFRTLTLAKAVYIQVEKLRIPFFAKNQMRRAAYSVILNLGEGNAYRSQAQRRKFFEIAYGSAKEVKVGIGVFPVSNELSEQVDFLCASIFKLLPMCPK